MMFSGHIDLRYLIAPDNDMCPLVQCFCILNEAVDLGDACCNRIPRYIVRPAKEHDDIVVLWDHPWQAVTDLLGSEPRVGVATGADTLFGIVQ